MNTGVDFYVRAIAIQSDGKIVAGGGFTTYNGVDVPDMIIRLDQTDGSVDTSFNNAGAGADNVVHIEH